jgi:terminal uridylyltransferase
LIEKLVKTIEPSARLLAFGSSQNSFGLRNSGTRHLGRLRPVLMDSSDMDLVVLIDDPMANLESSHLVQMIGDLLQRVSTHFFSHVSIADGLQETNFDVRCPHECTNTF